MRLFPRLCAPSLPLTHPSPSSPSPPPPILPTQHEGKSTVLEVDENTSILEAALDNDIELPHDCKLGVCLTCPSLIVSGDVDQSEGTLDDSVMEQVKASNRRSRGSCLEGAILLRRWARTGAFYSSTKPLWFLCVCLFLCFLLPRRYTARAEPGRWHAPESVGVESKTFPGSSTLPALGF